jgi:hypothetical protein
MRIGISVVTMNGEFRGTKQKVKMVKVRDLDRPSQFGLAPLTPDNAYSQLSEEEEFEAAVAAALRQLKEKKKAQA